MNGNDMIEHIESCETCIEIQDKLDSEDLDDEERVELEEEQYGCYLNSFSLGE